MDYMEEQNNEIEALDSIYCGDMTIVSIKPFHKFVIPIKTEEYEPESSSGLFCNLKFGYAPTYPEELPEVEIADTDNFVGNDEELLKEYIIQQAEENLGTVMIFTLVSSAQEWLNNKWDATRKMMEDLAMRKAKEAEEAEMKRFEGTRVTVESFIAWKKQFDEEFGFKKRNEKDDKDPKRMTGKELFMVDKTLIESDLKFLDEGTDSIKVDESLFQELEELDLDGDDTLDDGDS